MDRLSQREVSLLALDTARHPAHVGSVHVFSGDDIFTHADLVALVRDRISFVPRYRQRVRTVPGGLAAPVWVDDDAFDLDYHLRRSALPRPGDDQQLREFLGRVMSRRLDRSRPLWELYLVEGLADNRFAIVSKTHLALVDGGDTVDLGQVMMDADPAAEVAPAQPWQPAAEPSDVDLLVAAAYSSVSDPGTVVDNVRRGLTGVLGTAVAVGEAGGGVGATLGELASAALSGTAPAQSSPFLGSPSEQRRYAHTELDFDALRAVRERVGHTVNDVILAVITGGLRSWLMTRGEPLGSVIALVPMSVIDDDFGSALGLRVAPHLAKLPVGEPNPVMQVHQVAISTQTHTASGVAVGARELTDLAGFAPATLHAMGVRAAQDAVRRRHDLIITNVPGPREPVYAAGAPLQSSYPAIPLSQGHLLAIGITSYDGRITVGLTGDRDRLADIDMLAGCIADAARDLAEAAAQEKS